MGKLFLRYLDAPIVYRCKVCGTHLADRAEIVSKVCALHLDRQNQRVY